MSTHHTKRVILDKSFLQAESRDGNRLRLLCDSGAVLVLTDTLIYEFCTDSKTTQWPATQRKLFPIAEKIEVWRHSAELLKLEIEHQRPVPSPLDQESTLRVREWFNGGEVYVPPNMETLGQDANQKREIDTVEALISECKAFCEVDPGYTARIQRGGAEADALLSDLMTRDDFVRWRVQRCHGNPAESDIYIRGAEQGLGPDWFAYHEAKSTLALFCHYMSKYGTKGISGKDFIHTKLDADYVALLHYADGLATNETSGSLANICKWMHGTSKIIFSTSSLDAAKPKDEDARLEAYYQWERDGRTHGHDEGDWFWAKRELLWRGLQK